VVGIDEETFQRLDEQWPFPRSLHAAAIRRLLKAGARTVVYDVQFSEPSDSPRDDRALLRAAADPRVILGTSELDEDGEPAILGGAERLRRSGGRVGYVQIARGRRRGVARLDPVVDGVPHVAVLAAGGTTHTPVRPIHYQGPDGTFKRVSFADLVEGNVAASEPQGQHRVRRGDRHLSPGPPRHRHRDDGGRRGPRQRHADDPGRLPAAHGVGRRERPPAAAGPASPSRCSRCAGSATTRSSCSSARASRSSWSCSSGSSWRSPRG